MFRSPSPLLSWLGSNPPPSSTIVMRKAPILRSEYENMGGRAGRYGAGYDFGRSILVASTPFDAETLWRRYVEGEREPVQPQGVRRRAQQQREVQ